MALLCGKRVVFVHDAPVVVDFAETHGEAEFERFARALGIGAYAIPDGGCEGHITSRGDFHVAKGKNNGLLRARQKQIPSGHVGV